jgi:hypothetical protein
VVSCLKYLGKNEKESKQTEKNDYCDKKVGIGIDESESYMSNGKKGGQVIFNKVPVPLSRLFCDFSINSWIIVDS